jgi:hypothetical protein
MERYHRVHRKMLETIAELQGWMEELLRGASGPAALADLMKSLGAAKGALAERAEGGGGSPPGW